MKEKSIMPPSHLYETERREGLERHEPWGASNRQKSIEMGLYVFLTPQMHRGKNGAHGNAKFNNELKRIAQQTAMEHYGLTKKQWIAMFGRNLL